MIRDPKREIKLKKKKPNVGWDDIKPPMGDPMIPEDNEEDVTIIDRKKRLERRIGKSSASGNEKKEENESSRE